VLKIFRYAFDRMLRSKSMWLSLAIAIAIVTTDFAECIRLYNQGIDTERSVFYKWLGVNCEYYTGRYLFMSLPLITSIGYSWSVCHDRCCGYINQIITRTNRFKYFAAKFLVSFISGGIIFSAALIVHFMLLATVFPNYEPIPGDLNSFMNPFRFCSDIFYQNTYLFMLIWILTAFTWGGAMSGISLLSGMYIKKSTLTPIIPFIIFTCQQIISGYIMQKYRILLKGMNLSIAWNDMLFASSEVRNPQDIVWGNIVIIIIITAIFYTIRGRKYECL